MSYSRCEQTEDVPMHASQKGISISVLDVYIYICIYVYLGARIARCAACLYVTFNPVGVWEISMLAANRHARIENAMYTYVM